MSNQQPQQPTELVKTFLNRSASEQGSTWSELWDQGKDSFWDRGYPSPALIDLMEKNRPELFNPIKPDGSRKKALVPGCGRGYDVVMLALHGFDAYGLDIATEAVKAAEENARKELENPGDQYYRDRSKYGGTVRGSVTFVKGSFFESDWVEQHLGSKDAKFDLIYDYTFLCALHPDLRVNWHDSMNRLLANDGFLVCLEFPMYKDLAAAGPPWGLNGVHWDLLGAGNDGKLHEHAAEAEKRDGKFNRVEYYQAERTYEMGKDTDMISVYVLK